MWWEILLIGLWLQVGFVPGMLSTEDLSREDVLLLKDEQNPKCFTRTQWDFTCFFEAADNGTYDFLYNINNRERRRCEMTAQKTEEGTSLHICSFPDSDVYLFVETHIEVVERRTNASLYKRTISVEDHMLLDPPFNVTLHQSGQAGELRVSWQSKIPKYQQDYTIYRIRYSSEGLGEKTKEAKVGDALDSLIPGQETQVQVSVKCALNSSTGHWSGWSQPARAVAPQSADDISLTCYTSDLQNVTCQWNGSRYDEEGEHKLFYRRSLSEASRWTEWTECPADTDSTDLCSFPGEESGTFRVKLSSAPAPLSRTFYSQEFTLNKSIKTSPPSHPRRTPEESKLCLKWDAPLPSLSAHLQYEVGYRIRGGETWMVVSQKAPDTDACLEVPAGSKYIAKIRAKPTGSAYSGYWSDWSDVLTGDTPTDGGALLMVFVPVLITVLIAAIVLISLFPKYLSKLKLYIWPPVPDLDKVLQGFLTEINGQKWNPPLTAKQISEETTSSVVEIMSEVSSERSLSSRGPEVFPDYVTLNKSSVILCPNENKYETRADEAEEPTEKEELSKLCPTSCTDGSVCITRCQGTNLLNRSYWPEAEPADKSNCKVTAAGRPGNLYTNLPGS